MCRKPKQQEKLKGLQMKSKQGFWYQRSTGTEKLSGIFTLFAVLAAFVAIFDCLVHAGKL